MARSDTFDYLLQHIVALLTQQSDQVLHEQLGISMSYYKILRLLEVDGRCTQKEIAVALGQTEASISRQIRLMAVQNLLQTVRNKADRREHLTVLTPKGKQITLVAASALAAYYKPAFGVLNDKQARQLAEVLTRLHDALCNAGHPAYAEAVSKAVETEGIVL